MTPDPGSKKAIEMGCQCPVIDNCYGKGYMNGARNKDGEVTFVISGNCELHRGWDDDQDL